MIVGPAVEDVPDVQASLIVSRVRR